MRQKVYDIGEDGGRWLANALNEDSARLAVIHQLREQYLLWSDRDQFDVETFACEVESALTAKATKYFFVATDRDTELVYSNAPFGPRQEREYNADFLGSPGYAIGFTMPKWEDRP